jgi:thymidine phosphorylase
MVSAPEIIRRKRDGLDLSAGEIGAFACGLADGSWTDAQAGAMAMAILLRGMGRAETVALTEAMTRSGDVLDWSAAKLPGPLLDKHSTGGVGDKVSLLLAPIVAACGGVVPMISGRGLGHTGGTLDKLEALPGYRVDVAHERFTQVLREAGCAIVGATSRLAPADRRLYAIRDVTATVESLPLITASILSKKRAAGLQALVLDVKVGSGGFMTDLAQARALADSLVQVAAGAGLPARALITDMDQVLGRSAGNALEVQECLDVLCGRPADARLLDVTLGLSAELLQLGGLFSSVEAAHAAALAALRSGAAAERFARMVAALGGPADVLHDPRLPAAPVRRPVPALRSGFVAKIDVRAIGLAVVALGGGRQHNGDAVDPRVGFAAIAALGEQVDAGAPLATVHAIDAATADAARQALQAAFTITDTAAAVPPWCHARVFA